MEPSSLREGSSFVYTDAIFRNDKGRRASKASSGSPGLSAHQKAVLPGGRT
jgi:hypothetical protein